MMHFQRIDNALELCSSHLADLDSTNINDREVETYLVAGLIVLIVSEYEVYLESLFARRADNCGDSQAANYIKKTLSQKFRSPDLSKIHETLNRFDETYRDSFKNNIENSREHAAWDSLMKARHAVVHQQGSLNLTFRELSANYQLTKKVITNVESALGFDVAS